MSLSDLECTEEFKAEKDRLRTIWKEKDEEIRALREALVTIERTGVPGGAIVAKRQDGHSCAWCRGMWTPCPVSVAAAVLSKRLWVEP